MSDGVSGHSDNVRYLYASPSLSGLPAAEMRPDWLEEYSAVLPGHDAFEKKHVEESGHHSEPGILARIAATIKHVWNIIWNGPRAEEGGGGHH